MSVIVKAGALTPRMASCVRFCATFCVLFGAGVVSGHAPAWSFEVITAPEAQGQAVNIMRAPQAPAGDSCLYILNQAQERDAASARERYYRQSAGSAAAVGLVLGVRFALGPASVQKSRRLSSPPAAFRVWESRDTGGAQALAIADYRACRNEQTLRALTD